MYDPSIIKQHAAELYKDAEKLVFVAAVNGAVLGLVAGGGLGFGLGSATGSHDSLIFALVAAPMAGALGAWMGFSSARRRAFLLRLEAQRALVLVQIEENTRPRAAGHASQPGYGPPVPGYGPPPAPGRQ